MKKKPTNRKVEPIKKMKVTAKKVVAKKPSIKKKKPLVIKPKPAVAQSKKKAVAPKVVPAPKKKAQANKTKATSPKGRMKAKAEKPKVSPKGKMKAPKKEVKHTKREDKDYQSLYRKIRRRKKTIDELNEGREKGYKGKRTKVYKELVELNKELKPLCKEKKYKLPDSVLLREKRLAKAENWADKGYKKRDTEKQTITYTAKVWDFEDRLSKIIKSKEFKTIYLINVNKKFNRNSAPSTILYWYDMCRDEAYQSLLMSTPFVEVTEDYRNSIISIEVIS